jgi:hypothetical protein
MSTKLKTKEIKVDIFLAVGTEQYFNVPLGYKIKGSTAKEAYLNLIADFGDQNPNAIYRPHYVDLSDYGADFVGLRDEFYITNNQTFKESVKLFASEE